MSYIWRVAKGLPKNIQNVTTQCYVIHVLLYLACGKRPPQEHLEFDKSMLCNYMSYTWRLAEGLRKNIWNLTNQCNVIR